MWILVAVLILGFVFGRFVRDGLSAVFLACISALTAHAVALEVPYVSSAPLLLRTLTRLIAEGADVPPTTLMVVCCGGALFAWIASRPADRMRHWDEYGPRKRRPRATA